MRHRHVTGPPSLRRPHCCRTRGHVTLSARGWRARGRMCYHVQNRSKTFESYTGRCSMIYASHSNRARGRGYARMTQNKEACVIDRNELLSTRTAKPYSAMGKNSFKTPQFFCISLLQSLALASRMTLFVTMFLQQAGLVAVNSTDGLSLGASAPVAGENSTRVGALHSFIAEKKTISFDIETQALNWPFIGPLRSHN